MSLVETFHREHLERQVRMLEAALRHQESKATAVQRVVIESVPKPELVAAEPTLAVLDYRVDGGPVRIERIVKVVCEHFGVVAADLLSARRTANLIFPRHIVYCLCKQLTLHSLPAIGRRLGGRDHATIYYGVRKIERLMSEDAELRELVDGLISRIGGSDQSEKRQARKRLTEQEVRAIRASDRPIVDLAKQFNVTHGAIWHVKTNRTWRHVSDPQ